MIDRRRLLVSGAALGAAGMFAPHMVLAQAATTRRLLVILQRGAADGMTMFAPVGDPHFARLRGAWADEYAAAPRLGSYFALHPSLEQVGAMYAAGDALIVHAAATHYRERSHFDGQNLLETGGLTAYARSDGWLNRLLGILPQGELSALALAPTIPLAMRGANPVTSYAPSALPEASEAFLQRVAMLYAEDEKLSALWQSAMETRAMAGGSDLKNLKNAKAAGELAASLMRDADGAKIVMLDSDGWDSHAGQQGQLRRQLSGLDAMLGAYRGGMGALWSDTLVMVMTEFGRTAAINGTGGTDHGTGAAAMLLGGAARGGRVIADWPGLAPSQLYEGRDLRPTTALESLLAGALAEHFTLDPEQVMATLFPGRDAHALTGLVG